jgi:hypothetical protein
MLVLSFVSWWYGRGWKLVFDSFRPRLRSVAINFSVAQLLRTLFQPWRRIISYPGASLQAKMQAKLDNLVSRAIGFTVRLMVLLGALFAFTGVAVLTVIEILIWPLLPLAIPGCLIAGLVL